MFKKHLLLLVFMVLTVLSSAQSVKTTADPALKDYRFNTFRIVKGEFTTLEQAKGDEEKFFLIMKEHISRELEDKGYTFTEDSSAQVVVGYIGQSMKRMDTETLGPLGQTPTNDAAQIDASRNWSREYNQNSVVIEVVDFATRKTLWRATTSFEGQPLNENRTVGYVVYRAFKKFPANKKKK
jgi:hypothetical protein